MSILSELSRLTGKEGDSIVDVLDDVDSLGGGYVTAGATDKTKVGQFATAEGAPSAKAYGRPA